MKTFFEMYQPVFEVVARLLGNSWRVNLLEDYQHRIKLTSSQFKNFSVLVRMEKERLVIIGSVDTRIWRSPVYSCTVSPQRNAVGIAEDIRRKILFNARKDLETAQEYERKKVSEQEGKRILKGMLSQLLELDNWHGSLTGFKAKNGLTGKITEQNNGYEMLIRGVSLDQLIKLAGLINQLEE